MASKTLSESVRSVVNGSTIETFPESAVQAGASDQTYSPAFDGRRLSFKKFCVSFVPTVAFADVAGQLTIEGSLDGSTWVEIGVVSADTDPHLVAGQLKQVDFSAVTAPYMRFAFNAKSAVATGTSGKFVLSYAF